MSISRCFLRSRIEFLTLNLAVTNDREAIGLPPELCWVARIAELEIVEITKERTGQTFVLPVLFTKEGVVSVTGSVTRYLHLGDRISVSCFALVNEELTPDHRTTFVLVGKDNHAEEIASRAVRVVSVHPSYFPVLPPVITVTHREGVSAAAP